MATSQQSLGTGTTMEDKDMSDLENSKRDSGNEEVDVEKGQQQQTSTAPAVLDWDGPDDPGNPMNVRKELISFLTPPLLFPNFRASTNIKLTCCSGRNGRRYIMLYLQLSFLSRRKYL